VSSTASQLARISALKSVAEHLRLEGLRAQAARDQFAGARQQVMSQITAEFGVSSPEEARVLLERLDSAVGAETQAVEAALAAADGSARS
jgi:hypothetical protein